MFIFNAHKYSGQTCVCVLIYAGLCTVIFTVCTMEHGLCSMVSCMRTRKSPETPCQHVRLISVCASHQIGGLKDSFHTSFSP